MAFKEVLDLDCDTTIALGGTNRKTGKANPTQIEGYFLGSKQTVSKKSKTGFANLHIFQTSEGNVGVWGKTDLDRKLRSVQQGTMTRVIQKGTISTPNGDMYKYQVAEDQDDRIEVNFSANEPTQSSDDYETESTEETSLDDEGSSYDETPAPRATAPRSPAQAPDASRQAKVQALLAKSRTRA